MLFYYQVDLLQVINGNGPPPSLVLELVRLLPPGSACEATEIDVPEMLGYDIATRFLMNISDWAQATWLVSGNWEKGKEPKFQPEERPWQSKRHAVPEEGMPIGDLFMIFAAKAARQGS